MEMILTGIENKNEYYTNHYFTSIFQDNAEDTIKKWKEKEKTEEIVLPWKKLRDVRIQYYNIRDRYLRSKNEEVSKPLVQELATLYLDALGYGSVNSVTEKVTDGVNVPIFHEVTKANGAPLLWAFLSVAAERDDDILNGYIFEKSDDEEVTDQYLVIVDVCKGHTKNADFADILVLNRQPMMDGEPPVVAAEWHGHIDMDKLAWKAMQVAAYYNNALLVIESNTLETNNTKGEAEYILTLIHEVYGRQLYARKQSAEDIRQGLPKKYGYHTNPLTKKVVIYNLKVVIRERLYIEREEACLDEYLTYVETENNVFEAMEGYHDDRLMTRAIGMQVCYHEMELPRIVKKINNINAGLVQVPVSAATIG